MSNVISMLVTMAQSPILEHEQQQWLDNLAQAAALPAEQIAAMQQQELEQLLGSVQLHKGGCFMIIAPDVPEEPDESEEEPESKVRH